MKRAKHIRYYWIEFVVLFILTIILFNTIQSFAKEAAWQSVTLKKKVYLVISLGLAIGWAYLLYRSITKDGVVMLVVKKFWALTIPKGAKVAIMIVFVGNVITIAIAKSYYPFYEVGMFRWSSKVSGKDKTLYCPKYYYRKNGEVVILNLRKESVFLLADHLGWGYTHEFTFAANYHNKGEKANFDFLADKLKEHGIDSLWVGVHSVNYATGHVEFNPDICNAIKINKTKRIPYGPIYIPEYQLARCENEY